MDFSTINIINWIFIWLIGWELILLIVIDTFDFVNIQFIILM